MKVYVDLTDGEWRALTTCVSYSNRSCESCCAYPEMQNKKTKCYACDFTKDRDKLIHKLSYSSPIAHDKEVRKQVCDEIRCVMQSMTILGEVYNALDQIEKGE